MEGGRRVHWISEVAVADGPNAAIDGAPHRQNQNEIQPIGASVNRNHDSRTRVQSTGWVETGHQFMS